MKKVIDYSITPVYFYRFVCNDPNISNMYVGSSIDLVKRKSSHKSKCNNPNDKLYHLLVYKTIRDNGGWDNWRMLEIEHKNVKDKTEAKQREQYWIEFYNAQMNMMKTIPINIQEYYREYREQNKEQLIDYQREYYEKNKEQISNYQREYTKQHRDEIKEYYEQNKEQLIDYQREYREQNKEQINTRRREQYNRKKQEKQNINELV